MIQSNTNFKWRLDIIRKHTKIGEAKIKSLNINFVENANVTRSTKAIIPHNGFKTNPVEIIEKRAVYFDGSLCFNGSWTFAGINKISLVDVAFDMFSDRLRPVMVVGDKEYNFGDFIVISAPKTDDGIEQLYSIEAYDETMILSQSTLVNRKYYPAGTKYLNIILELITESGIDKVILDETDAKITIDREYAIGTNYLTIVNDLLDEIGYSHIYAGADGYCFIRKNITKSNADYYYTDDNSTLISEIKMDTDIYSLPNVIVGFVSSPDIPTVLKAVRINDNVKSVISTVRRGYNIVQTHQFDDCPDLETLSRAVDQKFLEATQATETVEISTMPDGNHEYGSYIALSHSGESSLYREKEWSIEADGTMKHKLERKVFV